MEVNSELIFALLAVATQDSWISYGVRTLGYREHTRVGMLQLSQTYVTIAQVGISVSCLDEVARVCVVYFVLFSCQKSEVSDQSVSRIDRKRYPQSSKNSKHLSTQLDIVIDTRCNGRETRFVQDQLPLLLVSPSKITPTLTLRNVNPLELPNLFQNHL